MAFANLFSGLSAICEDVRSPGGSDVTSSNRTENGSRGRKRKTQTEQPGSFKKRCPQFRTEDNLTYQGSKPCQKQVTERECSFPGRQHNSSYNSRQHCNGQNYQTKDNHNMKKERYRGKKNKKKYQQRQKRDAKPMSKQQAKPKFMTQEFKDQNALLVDGRLVCRHFLSGRCIKEDKCQLEHCQGYNGLIKDVCKFYVQGFCLKGESCPYMHKSFPCKFFHRKGKCLLEGNCRFSHEPLNDITEKLLDEAMKQEKYFYELANKNKEESSEQQANTEETKPTEEQKNPDLLTQPLRPSFYNSTDAEKEPREHPDVTEQGVADVDQPHSSSVNTQNQQEPVCYSVEAVLGPQLSRTFFSFSKTLVSQDSSSDRTRANQSNVPYSVEAVFSSDTSAGNSSNDQTPDPPSEQAAFYAPQVISEKIKAPPFRREKSSPNLLVVDNGSKETKPRSLLSLEVKHGPISEAVPVPHTSEEELGEQKTYTKQELLYPEKPSGSREIKHPLAGTKCHEVSTEHACPPKHPTQLKANLSKGTVAVPVEPVTTCNKRRDAAADDDDDDAVHRFQLSESLPNSKKKQSNVHTGTPKHPPNTFKSCSKTANLGVFSAERNKTQNRAFSSLFASPLTVSVTPGSESSTAAMKPRQTDVRIPSLPFVSLFAAPLSENPPRLPRSETQTADSAAPPCEQQSAESAASTSKQRDSDRRFSPAQVRTSRRQTSSESFKTENDAPKHPSAAVCSIDSSCPCDPSSSRTNQNLPDVSPSREASAPSVLKSLFVQLRPYQEDGEQPVTGQNAEKTERRNNRRTARRKTRTKEEEEVGGDVH